MPPSSAGRLLLLCATLLSAACRDGGGGTTPSPVPAELQLLAGSGQEGITVGSEVPVRPAVQVRDAQGRGVPGISVRFDVTGGGGEVVGDSVVTNADGVATVGVWRLGRTPGINTLRARVAGLSFQTSVSTTSVPGPPTSMEVLPGTSNLAAMVGLEVTPNPSVRVRDTFGNVTPGVTVTWTVSQGGGAVVGANTSTTNSQGVTTVAAWQLGPVAGVNRLRASTASGVETTIEARGIAVPTVLLPVSATMQEGYTDFAVPKVPRVHATDASGAPIAGIPVTFTMTMGTGLIVGNQVITDADGIAALGDWKLGLSGFSRVEATVTGVADLSAVFEATGVPRAFKIDVRWLGTVSADIRDVFIAAAMRWMEIIVGDLPDFTIDPVLTTCMGFSIPATTGLVDDLIIYAGVVELDGPGNVLGRAGPCWWREGPDFPEMQTALGGMQFDLADANLLLSGGMFVDVVLHEMGHVLGFLEERFLLRGLITGANGPEPIFTGPQAIATWPLLGINYGGPLVPLEADFGGGTRDSHWDEALMGRELMTGLLVSPDNPISVLTVAALADLGYVVDMSKADPFPPALQGPIIPGQGILLHKGR